MKKEKNKDRIKPLEGIGFTVGMLGFILLGFEGGSFKGQIIVAVLAFTLIGLGVLIFNLKKVVFFLAEKESALSADRPNRAQRKNINCIITESEKNVNGNTLEKII